MAQKKLVARAITPSLDVHRKQVLKLKVMLLHFSRYINRSIYIIYVYVAYIYISNRGFMVLLTVSHRFHKKSVNL